MSVARVSLPSIERTRELARALAVLDAILCPEPEYRYHAFDPAWGSEQAMASMRNGSGDTWYAWFGPPGAAILGFDHESRMSPWSSDDRQPWPGVVDGLPRDFAEPVLGEPAFTPEDVTFLIWREPGDTSWQEGEAELPPGDDPDGAKWLLEQLIEDSPQAYAKFAALVFEVEPEPEAVAAVWRGEPLTEELVRALKPDVTPADVRDDIAATGYPVKI